MKHNFVTANGTSRTKIKALGKYLILSMLCLCLPALAASPEGMRSPQAELSPQAMSDLWRLAWDDAFKQIDLSASQEEMVWQALALGSAETFASQQGATRVAALLSGLEKGLPAKQFLGAVNQMRPMFTYLEQAGYRIPYCICSSTVPTDGCASPCVANGSGITCIPNTIGSGTLLDGMCFTAIP